MREEKLKIYIFQLIRLTIQETNWTNEPEGRHGTAAAVGHRRVIPLSGDARDAHARGGADLFRIAAGFRGQLLPAFPPLLRKPAAHHPDLLQAARALALRPRPSGLGGGRRPRPRLPPARDGAALARHRGTA